MRLKERIISFFNPPAGSPRWMLILPYAILGVLVTGLLVSGAYGWEYTNSPQFCGTACHTMPPQNATYVVSPHANVYCTECHIGRAFVGQQLARKSEDLYEIYSMVFHAYEFPIRATRTKPDILTCEKCHLPRRFQMTACAQSLVLPTTLKHDDDHLSGNEDRRWGCARRPWARDPLAYPQPGPVLFTRYYKPDHPLCTRDE
jgi:hypothetical protein